MLKAIANPQRPAELILLLNFAKGFRLRWAMSRPIVVTVCMIGSSESGGLNSTHIHGTHVPGGGAVHGIKSRRCGPLARRVSSDYSLFVGRGFRCLALGFAQCSLFIPNSLFVLGSCARCPLSFSPVSPVIWFECHWFSVMCGLICYSTIMYMTNVRVLPVLLFARLGHFQRQR
jgi:hypothetical protein